MHTERSESLSTCSQENGKLAGIPNTPQIKRGRNFVFVNFRSVFRQLFSESPPLSPQINAVRVLSVW